MNKKIERGQFFTKRNIFKLAPFEQWWNLIPEKYKDNILEPFAGSNNIINLLKEINLFLDRSVFYNTITLGGCKYWSIS